MRVLLAGDWAAEGPAGREGDESCKDVLEEKRPLAKGALLGDSGH
jgi:hypothetical protein